MVTLQNTVFSNQQTLTSLQIEQMTGAVELVEALGGGWDARSYPLRRRLPLHPARPIRKIQQ